MIKTLLLSTVLLGHLQVTSYRSLEVQTDSTPFITASGDHVHSAGVALSRDLLKRWGGQVGYGDIVYIEGFGFKVVNDTMNSRYKKAIDIWVKTYNKEKAIGIQRQKVWLIKEDYNASLGR